MPSTSSRASIESGPSPSPNSGWLLSIEAGSTSSLRRWTIRRLMRSLSSAGAVESVMGAGLYHSRSPRISAHDQARLDANALAGDVAGSLRREEGDQLGDLLGPAQPPQ